MKHLLAACLTGVFLSTAAHAADPTPAQQAQRDRMAQCNQSADGKAGDERKAYMKDCLAGKLADKKPATAQQDKMKTCNQSAAGKTGDERKAFMKECLSAK